MAHKVPRGERVAQAISKRHKDGKLTGTKRGDRDSCASDIKIRTSPQRERSDTHTHTNHERVAGAHVRFSQKTLRAPRKKNIENVKIDVYLGLSYFLSRSAKYCAWHEKISRRQPKFCTWPSVAWCSATLQSHGVWAWRIPFSSSGRLQTLSGGEAVCE